MYQKKIEFNMEMDGYNNPNKSLGNDSKSTLGVGTSKCTYCQGYYRNMTSHFKSCEKKIKEEATKIEKERSMYKTEIRTLNINVNSLKNENMELQRKGNDLYNKHETLQRKLKHLYEKLSSNNNQVTTFEIAEYIKQNF
jgi:predicted  nucleic acid-binding Zn-ribbon protein